MGLEKSPIAAPPLEELLDADALRRALTALAQESPDPGGLRREGLGLITAAFLPQSSRRAAPSRPCIGVGHKKPRSAKCSIRPRKKGNSAGFTRFS